MQKNDLVMIEESVKLGNNVVIEPFCVIKGNTIIGDNVVIKSFSQIKDSFIGNNSIIESSNIENSEIKSSVVIGPFSHIKQSSLIKEKAVIGNYVEIKNSIIGKNSKVKHLSYVGDSEIGNNVNVGCGVVFANYNGKTKSKIKIGNNVFIGSNSVLIAPLNIEKNCYICAGTVLTKDLKENDFTISRCRETIKENRAKKYLKNYEE